MRRTIGSCSARLRPPPLEDGRLVAVLAAPLPGITFSLSARPATPLAVAMAKPSGIGSQRHVDHGRRRCHLDHQLVSLDLPFSAFQHRNQHLMPAGCQRIQHRVAQRIVLQVVFPNRLSFWNALWSDGYFGCSLGDRCWSCRPHHHGCRGPTGSRRRNACRGIVVSLRAAASHFFAPNLPRKVKLDSHERASAIPTSSHQEQPSACPRFSDRL